MDQEQIDIKIAEWNAESEYTKRMRDKEAKAKEKSEAQKKKDAENLEKVYKIIDVLKVRNLELEEMKTGDDLNLLI